MAHGFKTGGRQVGTPNRATLERRLQAQAGIEIAETTGALPLEILITVMRGGPDADSITERQLQAAVAAAPYIHPRLAAIAVKEQPTDIGVDVSLLNDDELRSMMTILRKITRPAPLIVGTCGK